MRVFVFLLLLATPCTAAPFSENLLACRAHALWLGDHLSNPQAADALRRYGEVLSARARQQAQAEGTSDVTLERAKAAKAAEWAARNRLWIFTREARDWSDYCNAFASHLGIDRSELRAAFSAR